MQNIVQENVGVKEILPYLISVCIAEMTYGHINLEIRFIVEISVEVYTLGN